MKNAEIIKKLELILESEAINYLESSERLFLMNVLQKSETKIMNYLKMSKFYQIKLLKNTINF